MGWRAELVSAMRILAFFWAFFGIAFLSAEPKWAINLGQPLSASHPLLAGFALVLMVPVILWLAAKWLESSAVSSIEAYALIQAWGACIEGGAQGSSEMRLPAPLPRMKKAFRVLALKAKQAGDHQALSRLGVGYQLMADAVTTSHTQYMATSLDLLREWSEIEGDPESPGDIAAGVIRAADDLVSESPPSMQETLRKEARDDIRRAAQEDS